MCTRRKCQATPVGLCVKGKHLDVSRRERNFFSTSPSPGLKLPSGSIVQVATMSNNAKFVQRPPFCPRHARVHSSDGADLVPDDADLASDERSSSVVEISPSEGVTKQARSQFYHRRPVMRQNRGSSTVSQRRRIWQERQTNTTNSSVRRTHRRNDETILAITRELERLLIELQRKPMDDLSSLLDSADALIDQAKKLSKHIKRGRNKTLTTAFYERVPQVIV